jgi:hypothetical protein
VLQKVKKSKRRKKLDNFSELHFRSIEIAIGRVALAWNSLHEVLGLLFTQVMGAPHAHAELGPMYAAVWQSAKFDRPKRELLRAAIKFAVGRSDTLKADIEWLLLEADKIEDARNDAIHSPLFRISQDNPFAGYHFEANKILSDTLLGNPRANKLSDDDLLPLFKRTYKVAIILRDYAWSIHLRLRGVARSPWPRRPSLPSRPPKKIFPLARRRALKK